MTARDIVTTAARLVVSTFGETWQYRQRTSTGAATPAFGSYTDIVVHETQRTWAEEYDEERDQYIRRERCSARTSDADVSLVAGDQLKDTNGGVWAVVAVASSGPGSRRYDLQRDNAILQSPRRGGVA